MESHWRTVHHRLAILSALIDVSDAHECFKDFFMWKHLYLSTLYQIRDEITEKWAFSKLIIFQLRRLCQSDSYAHFRSVGAAIDYFRMFKRVKTASYAPNIFYERI